MSASTAWLVAALDVRLHAPRTARARGDRGEGVISVAIAVLIMAFLGVAMWGGFKMMWSSTESKTNTQINNIGK